MLNFYADSMFGKLARFLRMLGYDTLYRREESVEEMLDESKQSGRVVISSSEKIELVSKKHQVQAIKISSTEITKQLKELVKNLQISIEFPPERMRCSLCNGNLSSREKTDIIDRIPERTSEHYNEFWECDSCSQIFWLGSHWEDIKRTIQEVD